MSAEICPVDTKRGPVLALAALSLPVNPADKAHFMAGNCNTFFFFETARTDPPPCTGLVAWPARTSARVSECPTTVGAGSDIEKAS